MQNSDLQLKAHPHYSKEDSRIGIIGILVFVALMIFGRLAAAYGYETSSKLSVVIGMIWMVAILLTLFFHSIRIKCPECEKITKNAGCLENGNLSRVCENCNILWDLGRQPTKG